MFINVAVSAEDGRMCARELPLPPMKGKRRPVHDCDRIRDDASRRHDFEESMVAIRLLILISMDCEQSILVARY